MNKFISTFLLGIPAVILIGMDVLLINYLRQGYPADPLGRIYNSMMVAAMLLLVNALLSVFLNPLIAKLRRVGLFVYAMIIILWVCGSFLEIKLIVEVPTFKTNPEINGIAHVVDHFMKLLILCFMMAALRWPGRGMSRAGEGG